MRYSPESLNAFVEAVSQGSFSAAARKLKKSQAAISVAISNLEADIGCALFDRSGKTPVLTDEGQLVLRRVRAILAASDRLNELSDRLTANLEPVLTLVMSDAYNIVFYSDIIKRFEKRFPDTELSCGPGEDGDVIALLQSGRASMGILRAQSQYPSDIAVARIPVQAKLGIYVGPSHKFAQAPQIIQNDLDLDRQLYMKAYSMSTQNHRGQAWSAPDYLTLMEFAGQGFGWAELPITLVEKFDHLRLVQLDIPGYPRDVDIDVAWSKTRALGQAGQWFLDQLAHHSTVD